MLVQGNRSTLWQSKHFYFLRVGVVWSSAPWFSGLIWACCNSPRWYMSMDNCWNKSWQNWRTERKTNPSATLSSINPSRTTLDWTLGFAERSWWLPDLWYGQIQHSYPPFSSVKNRHICILVFSYSLEDVLCKSILKAPDHLQIHYLALFISKIKINNLLFSFVSYG
jgi:hypothetical protein